MQFHKVNSLFSITRLRTYPSVSTKFLAPLQTIRLGSPFLDSMFSKYNFHFYFLSHFSISSCSLYISCLISNVIAFFPYSQNFPSTIEDISTSLIKIVSIVAFSVDNLTFS